MTDKELFLDCYNSNVHKRARAMASFQKKYEELSKNRIRQRIPHAEEHVVSTIYNDLFMRAKDKLPNMNHDNFQGYWFTILKLLCFGYLKNRKIEVSLTDNDYKLMRKYQITYFELLPLDLLSEADIETQLVQKEQQQEQYQQLQCVWKQLSEEEQLLWRLRSEEVPYKKIADTMGKSENATKTAFNRLKTKLEKFWKR